MTRLLNLQTLNRVISLGLLTLMILALIASPSAASRMDDLSPAAADLADPGPGEHDFRHEGE